jgi:hypothetical protein
LDAYCTGLVLAPDFVKIDAETAEPKVLRGSRRMLARHRPIIAVVVWDDAARNSGDDVVFLLNHGYKVFEYRAGTIIPHGLRERYEYTNLLFVRPRKAQGLAPSHNVAEDPKREIGNNGS